MQKKKKVANSTCAKLGKEVQFDVKQNDQFSVMWQPNHQRIQQVHLEQNHDGKTALFPWNILKRCDQVPRVDNQMKNLSLHTAETTVVSIQKCTYMKANAAVLISETQGAFTALWASCFPEVFLIGWPSLFLSEWGSGSKVLSVCNEISIRGKHDQSLKWGERGNSKRQGERRCISQGVKGAKQQGVGQGKKQKQASDPLSSDPRCSELQREGFTGLSASNQILFLV